jgi:hypothetical protein
MEGVTKLKSKGEPQSDATPKRSTVILTNDEARSVAATIWRPVLTEIPDFQVGYQSVREINAKIAKKKKKKGSVHFVQGGLPELGKRR